MLLLYYFSHMHFFVQLLTSWRKLGLEDSLMEQILRRHIESLSYPLSLILRRYSPYCNVLDTCILLHCIRGMCMY